MQPASILVKSIDGKIYKITDAHKGIKKPLSDSDFKEYFYDMYPQSGVYKDIDGTYIDIVDFLTSMDRIEITNELPTNPVENSLYIDKNERQIKLFVDDEWVSLGSGEANISSLTEEDIQDCISNAFLSLAKISENKETEKNDRTLQWSKFFRRK